MKQPIFVFGGIRITRRRPDNCDLLRGKNTLAESVLAVILFSKPLTTLDCKADKKTKAIKTEDGCKDTRMLSVRRRREPWGGTWSRTRCSGRSRRPIVWVLTIGSLTTGHIVRATHFLSIRSKHFTMSSKRREYHVDRHSKKAALFFVAFDANPDTRVKIPDAMRIKEYSPSKAADQSLQMQVRREADKIKGEAVPGPSAPVAAATSALLPLSTTSNVGKPALRTRRVGWSITRGVRPHSPSLTASKTSLKTMSGG